MLSVSLNKILPFPPELVLTVHGEIQYVSYISHIINTLTYMHTYTNTHIHTHKTHFTDRVKDKMLYLIQSNTVVLNLGSIKPQGFIESVFFNNTIFWNSCFVGFCSLNTVILCATDAWFILCTNKIYTYVLKKSYLIFSNYEGFSECTDEDSRVQYLQ